MSPVQKKINFTDIKSLSVELEFIIACNKVEGNELIKISLDNTDMEIKFKSAVTRLLKAIKKDGAIQLFIFENELSEQEKTESVYLLNKFPFLAECNSADANSIYIKL